MLSGPVPVGPIPQSGNSESMCQALLWDKYLKGTKFVFIINNLSVSDPALYLTAQKDELRPKHLAEQQERKQKKTGTDFSPKFVRNCDDLEAGKFPKIPSHSGKTSTLIGLATRVSVATTAN